MKKTIFIALLSGFFFFVTQAQTKELTLEDAVLGYYKGLYPERLQNLQWADDVDEFMYRTDSALVVKTPDGKIVEQYAAGFFKAHVPVENIPWIEGFSSRFWLFSKDSVYYWLARDGQQLHQVRLPSAARNEDVHFQTKRVAYTIGNNLYLADEKHTKINITANDDPNIVSGQAIARQEFGIYKGTFWSPSGKYLAFYVKDESDVEEYPLVDVTQTPAQLKSIKYPMNGRGSEEPGVGVYDVEKDTTIYLQLFDKAGKYHYVTNLTWDDNEQYIYLAELNRDQNHMWFNQYDRQTGKFVKTLFEETNPKWVQPLHPAYFIPGTGKFVWLSQKDGFWNLYLYHRSGKFLGQLTSNKWVAKDVIGFDKTGEYVYFIGTGEDPREMHFFKLKIKTGKQKQLTKTAGTHYVSLSPSGKYFLDQLTSVEVPYKACVKSTENKKFKTSLFSAPDPLKDYKVRKPEFFTMKGVNTDILYGRIIKPYDFDPNKKYPVLLYVYGGPNVQLVKNKWLADASLWMFWLANQGYIVYSVDNHGSDNRGFAFESVIFRRLGVVEAKDQMLGVAYMKTLPYVDPERFAVHGWSFGGYMTLTLMTDYPEVFNVGVAGGPVTDWKWYEVMYGERYMDTYQTNPEGFKRTSILNKIDNLQGKLLTIHGYMDDVVVPQHNIALHDAAIAKGVYMDFYLYPRAKHNVYGKRRVHLLKKLLNFIIKNNRP